MYDTATPDHSWCGWCGTPTAVQAMCARPARITTGQKRSNNQENKSGALIDTAQLLAGFLAEAAWLGLDDMRASHVCAGEAYVLVIELQ